MNKVFWSILAVIAVLSVSLPLHADGLDPNDPYFNERGDNWATSWGTGSNPSYLDPLSGMNTLVYFLNSNFNNMVTGDWLIKESTTGPVGDVVRFEFLGSTPVAFIYSDDTGGFAFNHPADVGLPAVYQANHIELYSDTGGSTGFIYSPIAGQPGFVPGASWGYGLESYDYANPVPEPATLLLLGSGLIGLAGYGKKKLFKK